MARRPVGRPREDVEERFWAQVRKRPGGPGKTGCWIWTGALFEKGYGKFWWDGTERAHIVSFRLHHGRWPGKTQVLRHSCDNRRCVRPGHLKAGTEWENTQDAIKRHRR